MDKEEGEEEEDEPFGSDVDDQEDLPFVNAEVDVIAFGVLQTPKRSVSLNQLKKKKRALDLRIGGLIYYLDNEFVD